MKAAYRFLVLALGVILCVGVVQAQSEGDYQTAGVNGNWSSNATWQRYDATLPGWVGASVPPTSSTLVTINSTDTVTVDGLTGTCGNLTVNGGLIFFAGTANTVALAVNGDLTVNGTFYHNQSSGIQQSMTLTGNILVTNGATLNLGVGSTQGIALTFNNPNGGVDQTVSATGTPTLFQFQQIVVNRPNISDRVVCSASVTVRGGNASLKLTKGTWEQTDGTWSQVSATATNVWLDQPNGRIVLSNNGSMSVTSSIVGIGGSNGLEGGLTVNTSGSLTVGALSNQARLQVSGGFLTIQSGTVNIGGRLTISGVATISGGNINIDPQGAYAALSATSHAFEVATAGNLTMSGGTITIVDPISATGAGLEVKLSTTATYNITGGTIRIGDGVSTSAGPDGFEVSTHSVPLWNMEFNGNSTAASRIVTLTDHTVARNLTLKGNLVINSGTLNANVAGTGSNITLGGSFTNNGTFNGGSTSTYKLNGTSAQSTGSTFPPSIPNLTIDNAAGVTLTNNQTVTGTLTLTSGNIITGANSLTIGSGGSVSRTSGHVVGALKKTAVTGAQTFDVGTSAGYTPVVATLTGTDDFTVKTNAGAHPSAISTNVLGMYWTLTAGAGITSADLVFNYLDGDVTGAEASYVFGKYDGSWSHPAGTFDTGLNTASITGVTSFSDWTLGELASLPVQMTNFTAAAGLRGATLTWKTASEVDNAGFEVERRTVDSPSASLGTGRQSTVVSNYVKIGFVAGAGTSTSEREYSYTDAPAPGLYAYRLKQIDRDGGSSYSGEVEVEIGLAPKTLTLGAYPNPFNPATVIDFTLQNDGPATLRVFNLIGQEVATLFTGQATAGRLYQVPFDASRLTSGIYVARLESGNNVAMTRLTVIK